jgi:iron-sulfur cluster assembly accessory protein
MPRRIGYHSLVVIIFIPEARGRASAEERKRMINLTNAAAEKVKGILEQEKSNIPAGGLRIYVQGGGCSGFSYGMVLDEAAEGDQIFEKEGIKVIVDPMSLRYLEGAEVDYKEDLMGGGFAIKNPNATSTCGCGHSFNAGGEGAGHGHGHGGHQH